MPLLAASANGPSAVSRKNPAHAGPVSKALAVLHGRGCLKEENGRSISPWDMTSVEVSRLGVCGSAMLNWKLFICCRYFLGSILFISYTFLKKINKQMYRKKENRHRVV